MTDYREGASDHRVYHVSVTVTYGAFVSATGEETAKIKALDMDFGDMEMSDDVSVDVELWVEDKAYERMRVALNSLNRKTAASESLGDTLTAVDPTQPTSTTREEVL